MANTIPLESVSFDGARRILDAFYAECDQRGLSLSLAVVDRGGNVVLTCRLDDAQLGSYEIAVDKAFTAVAFGHPTSAWASTTTPGSGDWGFAHTLGGRTVVFPGGVPLYSAGTLVGGVGVSGTKGEIDEEIARSIAEREGFGVSP